MTTLDLDDIQGLILRGYTNGLSPATSCCRSWSPTGSARCSPTSPTRTSRRARTSPSRRTGRRKPPEGEPATHCVNLGFTFAGPQDARAGRRVAGASVPGGVPGGRRRARREEWPARPAGTIPPLGAEAARRRRARDPLGVRRRTPTSWRRCSPTFGSGWTAPRRSWTSSLRTASTAKTSSTSATRTASRSPRSRASSRGSGSTIRSSACRPASSCSASRRSGTTRGRTCRPSSACNGSFAAFRVMSQDVPAFNRFLADEARAHRARRGAAGGEDVRALAQRRPARSCGRRAVRAEVPEDDRNMFDYESADGSPNGDREGLRCPRGAHIRRAFPRSQRVIDDFDGFQRRIVRRGMPYGPKYDPDGTRRRSRAASWATSSARASPTSTSTSCAAGSTTACSPAGRLGRTKDPLTGANDPGRQPLRDPRRAGRRS